MTTDRSLDHQPVIAVGGSVPGVIRRAIRDGHLVAVLPGVYARAEAAREPLVRMAALQLRDPDTVFTGLSAAGLLFDDVQLPSVLTATGRLRARQRGYRLTRREIDPDWIVTVQGLRCTVPVLTAVDLIPSHGGDFVDRLLRLAGQNGAKILARMWEALRAFPNRRGNAVREQVLTESRDRPWSAAERKAHLALREAGITGWLTNLPVRVAGETYAIDIAFPEIRLALEIDGYRYHRSAEAFERDRHRQNALVNDGWIVLRITWSMLQSPAWLDCVRLWLDPWTRPRPAAGPVGRRREVAS